ncbi:MAG TPA: hypothetical protein VF240_02205 [Pyrinomonadaceae bacterium]
MLTPHPLNAIHDGWPVLASFSVLLVLFLLIGNRTKGRLLTPEAPRRAVSLELAGTEERAEQIINSWAREGMIGEAYRHLRWDAFLIPVYSTLWALGCVIAARAFFGRGTTAYDVALAVAWLPWLAGVLDYVENGAMYGMLDGFDGETLPRRAWWCAAVKFAIIIPLGVYSLAGVACYAWKWFRGVL